MEKLLTSEERKVLIAAAREAIEERLSGRDAERPLPRELSAPAAPRGGASPGVPAAGGGAGGGGAGGGAGCGNLQRKRGAFVTLTLHGQLRGCIGFVIAERPLLDTVREAARAAAFQDPRFTPLRGAELPEVHLEISVLGEPRRVRSLEEIRVGEHGLIVRRGFRSGLLLPQVATEYGWDRDTFLCHTCVKAGLPRDSWRDPDTEIQLFGAEVFGEEGA
jgi:AmmeMemoRadiSam system protein A